MSQAIDLLSPRDQSWMRHAQACEGMLETALTANGKLAAENYELREALKALRESRHRRFFWAVTVASIAIPAAAVEGIWILTR